MNENLIMDKSYSFSLQVIEFYKFLTHEKRICTFKTTFKMWASQGANVNEVQAAISKKGFVAKMSIPSREARESKYWLMLLKDSGYINHGEEKIKQLFEEIESIIKILTSVKSRQQNAK